MFKLLSLMKRRPGMTMREFIECYETHHTRIGIKYLKGSAVHYTRRYLFPVSGTAGENEAEFDVLMEIWFPDRETYENTMARLSEPDSMAEIIADEERLFDRPRHRVFTVEEHETAF